MGRFTTDVSGLSSVFAIVVALMFAGEPATGQLCDLDGLFASEQRFGAGESPKSVALGDLDGDGDLDMVVANHDGGFFSEPDDSSVLLNNGDGTFAPEQRYSAGLGPEGLSLADMDGDGNLDIAIANFDSDDVSVLLNIGNGVFGHQTRVPAGDGPAGVAFGDLDGDGDLDMVTANFISDDASVLLGNGDGTFTHEQRYGVGENPLGVSLGDVNRDGIIDIVVVNRGNDSLHDDVSVLLNSSNGSYGLEQRYDVGDSPSSVMLDDLDADGELDLIVTNRDSGDVSVLLNKGGGIYPSERRFGAGLGPRSVSLGDLDGDGDLDMAVANIFSDDTSILLHQCGGLLPCSNADFAQPFGILNFNDVIVFLTAFSLEDSSADLGMPAGTFDFIDVLAFLSIFVPGCP